MPTIHGIMTLPCNDWLIHGSYSCILPFYADAAYEFPCTGAVMAMMKDNLFQKIIDREVRADIVYEDDKCLAFRDINPQAPVHVLIIPRHKVIPTHADVTEADRDLVGHLHVVAARLAEQLGVQDGYRLIVNCKDRAG